MKRAAADTLCWTLLALFTLSLLKFDASYLRGNHRLPAYDEAWYLETSLQLYRAAAAGNLGEFAYKYGTAFGTKAPLLSVLPVPLYALFGPGYRVALLVNALFLALSIVYLFLLARRLFSPGIALAAVVFYQTMPLAYGLARAFMPEYGLTALVIIWIYYLVASDLLSRGSANFALGLLLGFGLLMKILFPLYIAGPLVLVLLLRRNKQVQPAEHSFPLWRLCARHPLAAMALPAVLIASTWYAFNLPVILRYGWSAGYGKISQQYEAASFTGWLLGAVNEGLSAPYAAALLVLGIAALTLGKSAARSKESNRFVLAWLIVPLAAIAVGRNQEIRFLLPVLPAVAILLALAVFRLGRRPALQAALVILVAAFPLRLLVAMSSPPSPADRSITLGPLVLLDRDLGWAHAPDMKGYWHQQLVLDALRHLDQPGPTPHYVVVGAEHPFFNANLLSYLDSYSPSHLRFTSFGYAESSADAAVARLSKIDARFLVMVEGLHKSDLPAFLNQVNDEVQARLDRGELPYRLRAKVTLYNHINAVIYQREGP